MVTKYPRAHRDTILVHLRRTKQLTSTLFTPIVLMYSRCTMQSVNTVLTPWKCICMVSVSDTRNGHFVFELVRFLSVYLSVRLFPLHRIYIVSNMVYLMYKETLVQHREILLVWLRYQKHSQSQSKGQATEANTNGRPERLFNKNEEILGKCMKIEDFFGFFGDIFNSQLRLLKVLIGF